MGWLGDGVGAEAECCPRVRRGFLGTWHSERAGLYSGRRGCSPSFLVNLALWLRPVLAPSPLGTRGQAPPGRGYPGPASGASSRPALDNAGRAPPPEADAARAAANHRLWLGSLKKEEPAAVWLSAGEGSLRPCKHTS